MRTRRGLSLLEVQVSALLAAMVFAGLAVTLSVFGEQIRWLQTGTFHRGKASPVGLLACEPEIIKPGEDLTGKYMVDVRGLLEDGGAYIVVVERRPAASTDCGR